MATKNLARTIIEGGRAKEHADTRKLANKQERRNAKNYLRRVIENTDLADELSIQPASTFVYKSQRDNLAPLRKWFNSKAGQKWDDVYSEARSRWDIRTIKGYHLIRDHLPYYSNVPRDGLPNYRSYENEGVDDNGICHPFRPYGWSRKRPQRPRRVYKDETVRKWLNHRKVAQVGSVLFWYVDTKGLGWSTCYCRPRYRYWLSRELLGYECGLETRQHFHWHRKLVVKDGNRVWEDRKVTIRQHYGALRGTYRQDKKLTKDEIDFWRKLTDFQKKFAELNGES